MKKKKCERCKKPACGHANGHAFCLDPACIKATFDHVFKEVFVALKRAPKTTRWTFTASLDGVPAKRAKKKKAVQQ